ncbi:Fe-S-containing hydro-lyase [Candidatus Aerophobetes bacterium]|uniref:Fe-S-containing hydro-lyase n=1 Tax=Aerophobetes bacterium TaxID=2030807 RepID=A0A662DFV1_UNCAE|nr:MAG: Fe-S-containing hydro-lyase [Candidatus Aerophobetes bacterium]
MREKIRLNTPFSDRDIEKLKIGDEILLTGIIYTARDMAHKRIVESIEKNEPLPFNLKGQVIYYTGPAPARPGRIIGSAGPTTSYRMDPYTIPLIKAGLKGMIGKGPRSKCVIDAMAKYKAVYFAAIGGAAAFISEKIKKARTIAYEDLGPEAIWELEVEDFPVILINDIRGNDLYREGIKNYRR